MGRSAYPEKIPLFIPHVTILNFAGIHPSDVTPFDNFHSIVFCILVNAIDSYRYEFYTF